MGGRAKKKARSLPQEIGDEDRISRLPDELIHKILSFVDAKEAVQTSLLSRRWELIWTTLPFLSFCGYAKLTPKNVCNFMGHFLLNRNHQSNISDLNLRVKNKGFYNALVDKYVEYAISHNVQSLTLELSDDVDKWFKLSTFSSKSIKELTLKVKLKECALFSDLCALFPDAWHWYLPSLTTLHLKCLGHKHRVIFSKAWFRCLPALTTLRLDDWRLSELSFSFRLPALTTLSLSHTTLPEKSWKEFSNLLSLQLEGEDIPHNINDILSALVCLQNLTLCLSSDKVHFISCPPQLLNLSIRTSFRHHGYGCSNIVVSAAKLCNFTSFGIFTATIGVPELENVNIRLREWFESWLDNIDLERKKQNYRRLINLLPGLNYAKNLTFDLKSIEVLNEISSLLVGLPSPFFKLKHVKLPRGFEESTISCALRSYLLGGSPNATFVTKLPQSGTEGRWGPVGAQDPIMHSGCRSILMNNGVEDCMIDADRFRHNDASVEGADKDQASSLRGKRDSGLWRSHENNGVEDFMVDADRVRHIDASVEGTDKDQASSSRGKKDSGLWRCHEVDSEFVSLLDRIMHKYPETFEHFTTKNRKLCTMNLNMLCTSLNDFFKITMANVDLEIIGGYREVFSYLQNQGFNVSWVVDRLNYIEHLRFSKPLINELHSIDCHIDDAKINLQELQARADDTKVKLLDLLACVDDAKVKLQDKQTLRMEKLSEIEKAFGTKGTNLVVGCIGDDLLSNP